MLIPDVEVFMNHYLAINVHLDIYWGYSETLIADIEGEVTFWIKKSALDLRRCFFPAVREGKHSSKR